ncbi:MAG TPA: secretin and TonB N-terminal domain-containing protein, partial [Planctomycetota bacterium]|nr:secretin and TonB N-terminal domain-containing protein [Planctomycetota bacterium]
AARASRGSPAGRAPVRVPPAAFGGEPRGPKGAAPVSEEFVATDIHEAIASLAAQAGVRVVVDDAVRGSVTASFDKVPFEDALGDVLTPHGYVFARRGERYLVGTSDPKSAMYPLLADTREY